MDEKDFKVLRNNPEEQGEQNQLDYPYVTGWRENRPDNKPQTNHSVLMLTTHGVVEGEWLADEQKWRQYRWSSRVKDVDVLYWLHLPDLESLEKEGEQKVTYTAIVETGNGGINALVQGELSADKVGPKFKVGDWITNGEYTWLIDNVCYNLYNTFRFSIDDTDFQKDVYTEDALDAVFEMVKLLFEEKKL